MLTDQLNGAVEKLFDFLLPRICCGCGQKVQQRQWLVCETCLDSIPHFREPICQTCGFPDAFIKPNGRCKNCPPGKIWFAQARGAYLHQGLPAILVEKLKYLGRLEYAPLMALAMARLQPSSSTPLPDCIVPVPLHSTRQRERGFNQSLEIARRLGELKKIAVEPRALKRVLPTPSQTRLSRRERRRNIAGAFTCPNPALVRNRHVLLVDDVFTTGSTLNECAKTLVEHGAVSVQCLAYARAILGK